MPPEPIFAYAYLNARIGPFDRGDRYEEPLAEALAQTPFGEITGGGSSLFETGEIEYCGLDIDLLDVPLGAPFICDFLARCGAPKGSKLQFEQDGQKIELPFGDFEGLAIYLNGTDLPDEVYQTCDINVLYEEINRLLGDAGSIQGHWQGPTETALYLYGPSVAEMWSRIDPYITSYPLCQQARFVPIA